ncbi:MAG: Crp/Fnr family transcriptional regulator [Flavobacteriales bacterium]|nr:Crp/Fnr family transcriptional regulator [Flavobacteriales bacterium]
MLQCEEQVLAASLTQRRPTDATDMKRARTKDTDAMHTRMEWLNGHPFFNGLRPSGMERLADLLMPRAKEKGDYLYQARDVAETLFFITLGQLKLCNFGKDGREVIREVLTAGDIVGETALLGQRLRTDNAVAMSASCLYSLPLTDVLSVMDGNPEFALSVTQCASDRLVRTARRMESLVLHDARTRMLQLIIDLAETYGRVLAGGSVHVTHGLTHFDMGGLTAISRQTVTTLLNELREEGLINFDRRSILVHDPSKLVI